MDPDIVEKLEHELELAIGQAIGRLGAKRLPHSPSRHVLHLMAKAAVTVYEAVAETSELDE